MKFWLGYILRERRSEYTDSAVNYIGDSIYSTSAADARKSQKKQKDERRRIGPAYLSNVKTLSQY